MPKYVETKKVWEILHGLGGCGAKHGTFDDGWDKAIDTAISKLDDFPPADIRKECHRHWESEIAGDIQKFSCSGCGVTFKVPIGDTMDFKYCPNCGAKMDKEE